MGKVSRISICAAAAAAAGAMGAMSSATLAATTGWNVVDPGSYTYEDTANWVDGTVTDNFDTSLTLNHTLNANLTTGSGMQVLSVQADRTISAAPLTFSYASGSMTNTSYGFILTGGTDRTLTLANDVIFAPQGSAPARGSSTRRRAVTIGSATEKLAVDLAGGTRTFNIGGSGDTAADLGEGVTLLNAVNNGSIIKTGGGRLRLAGSDANTLNNVTVSAGVLTLMKSANTVAVAGNIYIDGGGVFFDQVNQLSSSTNITLVSGSLHFARTSASSSGSNSSPGQPYGQTFANLDVQGGTFTTGLRNTGSSGGSGNTSISGVMNVSGGSVIVRAGGTSFFANTLNITGTSTTWGVLVSSGTTSHGTTTLVVGSGGLNITNLASGSYTPINLGSTGAMTLRGDVTFTGYAGNTNTAVLTGTAAASTVASTPQGKLSLDGGMRTFTVHDGDAEVDLSVNSALTITNGALTKSGNGTFQIDSASTYAGGTTVAAGRLVLTSTHASAVAVTGGVLAGGGTLSAGATVNSGSVNPGSATAASLGVLTTSALTFTGGKFTADVDTTTNTPADTADKVVVTSGNVDLGAGLASLELVFSNPAAPEYLQSFVLVQNTGSGTTSGYFALPDASTPVGNIQTFSYANAYGLVTGTIDYAFVGDGDAQANDVRLTLTAVPEPACLSVLGLAAMGLLGRRRRR